MEDVTIKGPDDFNVGVAADLCLALAERALIKMINQLSRVRVYIWASTH